MLPPAQAAEEPAAAFLRVWIGGGRRPQYRPVGKYRFRWKDPNDGVGLVVQLEDPPQHIPISLEHALPEIVAKQRYLRASLAVLFVEKISPQHRLQAENIQEIIGWFCSKNTLRISPVPTV